MIEKQLFFTSKLDLHLLFPKYNLSKAKPFFLRYTDMTMLKLMALTKH